MKYCKPHFRGIQFENESALKDYLKSVYSEDIDYVSIDSSEIRIQLDVGRDTEVQMKNLPVQIISLIGVLQKSASTFKKVHNAIASNISKFIRGTLLDSTGENVSSNLRSMMRHKLSSAVMNERLGVMTVVQNRQLSLAIIRNKFISRLISQLNNKIKPELPGNAYAQGTIMADIYEYEDGTIVVGKQNIDPNKKVVNGPRRQKPMLYMFDGKVIEPVMNGNVVVKTPVDVINDLIQKDPKNKERITVSPAEVIMPYPYRELFGLSPDMNLAQSREYIKKNYPKKIQELFEQSLELVALRIPTTNGSLGFKAKIIEFIEDSGNTILIPAEQNIMTGADQDIDMLHAFFKVIDRDTKNEIKQIKKSLSQNSPDDVVGKLEEADEEMEKELDSKSGLIPNEKEKYASNIFEGLVEFYDNPENVLMVLNPVNMRLLDKEIAIIKEQEENATTMHYNTYHTGQEMHKINQDGKQVGFFANMNSFFAKIFSLSNVNNFKHSTLIAISNLSNIAKSKIIAFTDALTNAATDNAKDNKLGRLKLNEHNVSLIAGLLSVSENKLTERDVLRISRHPKVQNAVNTLSTEIKVLSEYPNKVASKIYELLSKENHYSPTEYKKEFLSNYSVIFGLSSEITYEEAFRNILILMSKEVVGEFSIDKVIEDATNGKTKEEENIIRGNYTKLYNDMQYHVLFMSSLIGARVTEFGLIANITKELPTSSFELTSLYEIITNALGMSIEDFLTGKNATPEEQVQFVTSRMSKKTGYVGKLTVEQFNLLEITKRNPDITFDLHELLRTYPNFMDALMALEVSVKRVLPETFLVNRLMQRYDGNKTLLEVLREVNEVPIITYENSIKQIESTVEDYIIGNFIASLDDEYRIVRFSNAVYDLKNADERMAFIGHFSEMIKNLMASSNPEINTNEFLKNIGIETTFEHSFPYITLDVSYNANPHIVNMFKMDMLMLNNIILKSTNPELKLMETSFSEALALYNLIVYGFSNRKGSFIDIVADSNVYKEYTKYERTYLKMDENDESYKTLKDGLIEYVVTMNPGVTTVSYNYKNKEANPKYTNYMFRSNSYSKKNKVKSVLVVNNQFVAPKAINEINIAGTDGAELVDYNSRIEITLDQYTALKRDGFVKVRYSFSKYVPSVAVIGNETVKFVGITTYGQPVMVSVKSTNGKQYNEAMITLTHENNIRQRNGEETDGLTCEF